MFMDGDCSTADDLSCKRMSSWYFTSEEIEQFSPSRKDGIDGRRESELRQVYCSFIQDIGIRLRLPQITIATAIIFCHRFYLHQSLARNGWQTIGTVCVFLASKVEDTPVALDDVVKVGYETMFKKDPGAARQIRLKDVFEKQKALILIAERVVLTTIRFEFNIQHPYRPLIDAMKSLGITQREVQQVAWNFINDWLRTTLPLQYKPHYIAAGSLYLAAKLHNVRLPLDKERVWWHRFDVAPKPLEAVIQQMMGMHGLRRMPAMASKKHSIETTQAKEEISNSPDSVLTDVETDERFQPLNGHDVSNIQHAVGDQSRCGMVKRSLQFTTNTSLDLADGLGSESMCRKVDEFLDSSKGECVEKELGSSRRTSEQNITVLKVDVMRIKEKIKKRKHLEQFLEPTNNNDELDEDAWIERELESGITVGPEAAKKRQRVWFTG